jgi:hypothetical protein
MNSLDIFGKFKDRQSASSVFGGVTSLIALIIVLILFSTYYSRMRSENLHRELKIDFHKADSHIDAHIDMILYNAPCDIVTLDYKDYLGEDIRDIEVSKTYVNAHGSSDGAPAYDNKKPVSAESVAKTIQDWPGCRLTGVFDSIMKVKGILYASFQDHLGVYEELTRMNKKVNLEYKIEYLYFGSIDKNTRIMRTLHPYHEDIKSELNPFLNEQPHRDGMFTAYLYIQVFPFQVIDDTIKETWSSYQYSYIKNYKQVVPENREGPTINFELDFLPIISVYHIKVVPRFKTIISLLGACGGVFAVLGIINAILARVGNVVGGGSKPESISSLT